MYLFILSAVLLFLYMNIAFIVSLIKKNNGFADVFYGGGFLLIALISYAYSWYSTLSFIVLLFTALWAIRLIVRIYLRNKNKEEDYRYKKWREEWGKNVLIRSYLQIYISQGIVIYIISLPIILLALYSAFGYFYILLIFGVLGWIIGFLFEFIGDLQLDRFIKNPENKGKLLTTGLWKYTRHPNYFGESLVWWSVAVFTLGGIYNNLGIISLVVFVSPILITYTLLKYSGIPMLEKKSKEKPGWEEYSKKTNAFIPWFPKK